MSKLRLSPLFFRRIHKWVGLILGLQFVLWTISGTAMALIDQDAVGGHGGGASHAAPLAEWGRIARPGDVAGTLSATGVTLRSLAGRPVYELQGASEIRLIDAATGVPIAVDAALARHVVTAATAAQVRRVTFLEEAPLEAREHKGAMWRVDLADAEERSAYVSATTGRLLEVRGSAWRWWDFFWMLHNMDYANRASFNHPLIVFVASGTLWLSLTGFYLLFKSFKRRDFRWVLPRSFLTR